MKSLHPFRGQYFFGHGSRQNDDFVRSSVSGRDLFTHRELPLAVTSTSFLAGFAFDWKRPDDSLSEILARVASAQSIHEATNSLSGRWVLFVCREGEEIAFNDACGTLPIVHASGGFSSSASFLQNCMGGLTPNTQLEAAGFRALQQLPSSFSGLPYPATITDFVEARLLLPGKVLRNGTEEGLPWPPYYGKSDPDSAAFQMAHIMSGIFRSMAKRHDLTIAMTAGYDSRAILGAASKVPHLISRTRFFTFEDQITRAGNDDLTIGKRLVELMGGNHEQYKIEPAPPEFIQATRQSEPMISVRSENWAYGCSTEPFKGRLTIIGWCSEIGRAFIRWEGDEEADATDIRKCAGLTNAPDLQPVFDEWYAWAKPISEKTGIHLLDLFYWTVRCPTWVAGGLNIYNSVSDWVTPYSCRDLLNSMLSVRPKELGDSGEHLYRRLLYIFDDRLLSIPINPMNMMLIRKGLRKRMRSTILTAAKLVGADRAIKKAFRKTR